MKLKQNATTPSPVSATRDDWVAAGEEAVKSPDVKGMSRAELAEIWGVTRNPMLVRLRALIAQGKVVKTGKRRMADGRWVEVFDLVK